jgi:hypothetical protein
VPFVTKCGGAPGGAVETDHGKIREACPDSLLCIGNCRVTELHGMDVWRAQQQVLPDTGVLTHIRVRRGQPSVKSGYSIQEGLPSDARDRAGAISQSVNIEETW